MPIPSPCGRGLNEPELLDYRYSLVDMHRVDCTGLLTQDNPDALVLAILCDFGDRKPQEVVTYIVHRLRELLGADERGFREHMTMLEILSKNRDLQAQVEEAEHMLTVIKVVIKGHPFCLEGKRGQAQLMGRFSRIIRLTFSCKRPNAAVRLLSNLQARCHAALGV